MKNLFNFLFNSLLGGCILLGIGLSVFFTALVGEKAGGSGLIVALGLYVILNQFKHT
jgi:hypothetical protein